MQQLIPRSLIRLDATSIYTHIALNHHLYKHCHLNQQIVNHFSHNLIPTIVKYAHSFHSWCALQLGHQQLELTTTTTTSFPASILENPRQQYRYFYRAVVAAYGAACTTVHQHGLLGYIVSDAQWTQLPGNSVPNANPDLPNEILPRPNVTIPATPPATASALTIKVWERRLADNVLVTDNLRTLKAQLLASVQPADLVILHDPIFGLLNVTASTILAHLTVLHGTLNRSDFAHLRALLSNTMTPSESLQDFIGVHQGGAVLD